MEVRSLDPPRKVADSQVKIRTEESPRMAESASLEANILDCIYAVPGGGGKAVNAVNRSA